jgi:hypothetical protein
LKNFDKGQSIHMDADGNVMIRSPGGVVHINPD